MKYRISYFPIIISISHWQLQSQYGEKRPLAWKKFVPNFNAIKIRHFTRRFQTMKLVNRWKTPESHYQWPNLAELFHFKRCQSNHKGIIFYYGVATADAYDDDNDDTAFLNLTHDSSTYFGLDATVVYHGISYPTMTRLWSHC